MSALFLKRGLEAAAKDTVPIGANSSSKRFKMPKPPAEAPPPRMLVMNQQEADMASAHIKDQYTDAMVITVDGVDVPSLMEKGLKWKENMDLVKTVSQIQGVYRRIGEHRDRPVYKQVIAEQAGSAPPLYIFYGIDDNGWFVAEKLFDSAQTVQKSVRIVDRTNYNQFNCVKHVNDIHHNSDWQPQ